MIDGANRARQLSCLTFYFGGSAFRKESFCRTFYECGVIILLMIRHTVVRKAIQNSFSDSINN